MDWLLRRTPSWCSGPNPKSSLASRSAPRMVAIVALLVCPLAWGQSAQSAAAVATLAEPKTVVDILHQLSDRAEVVFTGQVLAVRRSNNGVVEVEFRVDQAIRGCSADVTYTVREWAGLWVADTQRYRVGEHLLMLLHAPGAAGLSSPVGGLDGAIPIRRAGASANRTNSPGSQRPYVDLRWLGMRLPRTVTYRSELVHAEKAIDLPAPFSGPLLMQSSVLVASGPVTGTVPVFATSLSSVNANEGSVPAQQASVDAVISMLASWQKVRHGNP
jgi:hypothetical protein